ncbi:hypothetical protein [Nonlabens dokdonensis]|uniref:hypothetical protein n=1 Tax=Nonlabens dokdonensis TaxID=328515 RepID=UPI0026E9CEBC|nr:hypothetical protein [Nonlabens dokdonensis]
MKITIDISLDDTGKYLSRSSYSKDIPITVALNALKTSRDELVKDSVNLLRKEGYRDMKDKSEVGPALIGYKIKDLK